MKLNKKKLIIIFASIVAVFTTANFAIARQLDDNARQTEAINQLLVPTVGQLEATLEENLSFDSLEEEIDQDIALANRLIESAEKHLGTRYVWGATGPKSFDCSGFTGYVFKSEGITLPRTSSMQYKQGEKVADKQWQPGDLLFFSSRRSGKGKVGHVAMVVDVNDDGSCTFIHASTKKGVTYQKFPDNAYYSRNYIGAKRII